MVVVPVELGNPAAEAMHHHQRYSRFWGRSLRLEDDGVNVDVGADRNMKVFEV